MMVRWGRKECDKLKCQIQETIDLWNRKTFTQNYWEPREEGKHAKRRYSRTDKSRTEEGSLSPTKRRRLNIPDYQMWKMEVSCWSQAMIRSRAGDIHDDM
ncbi:hypothetical protein F4809DRAFT_588738 [Biscogniauxia mediterranea]|nr:hypothetical protein F4809DRAFT_588738 [Biscogniauxia mediterranea]